MPAFKVAQFSSSAQTWVCTPRLALRTYPRPHGPCFAPLQIKSGPSVEAPAVSVSEVLDEARERLRAEKSKASVIALNLTKVSQARERSSISMPNALRHLLSVSHPFVILIVTPCLLCRRPSLPVLMTAMQTSIAITLVSVKDATDRQQRESMRCSYSAACQHCIYGRLSCVHSAGHYAGLQSVHEAAESCSRFYKAFACVVCALQETIQACSLTRTKHTTRMRPCLAQLSHHPRSLYRRHRPPLP